ncbi:MAG: riboflavin biosynthesis protein RibF [Deltaproteobacteria bacterium GWA2_38_16]|nr:MAG: riboflavin biosynthesis protein RibF [Deltaproteobacteria bacterium GWA2_38_16]OGQ02385.1 MAG: riboflavin biosynthesis protein RibF [Deltaproteobacteria bacterium RIFCSPHIGHO2_02_FULL_38_15]OGQ33041.1 MAG: riboflavin biosynthesis protein RibF [Deltaproteobacteria bacterium RIFCSPLOWO2_01_FULL_38_9]HBQ20720.1 bifunctional riboflavin kinase/FAD synthetase [Deltaproteobacteria bacterium]
MIVYRTSKDFPKTLPKPIVAIGNFDGVHLGHKEIFSDVVKKASMIQGTSVVYTLYPHPSCIIHPETCEPQINSIEERLTLIENQGIDITVVENFNREFSEKTAQDFFKEIILTHLKTKILYVGYNFFFGKGRSGNTELLKKWCDKENIELHITSPFKIEEEVVSSSKIRMFIKEGEVKKAQEFLGRHYFIQGVTVKGEGRGKKLGIPTANIETHAELIPKIGVYITLTEYKNILYPSVTNVGHAPTFLEKSPFSIETHMMDFHHTLYGESLIIHFVDWIRPIKKFDSPKHLVAQIKCDIETAQKHFKKIS